MPNLKQKTKTDIQHRVAKKQGHNAQTDKSIQSVQKSIHYESQIAKQIRTLNQKKVLQLSDTSFNFKRSLTMTRDGPLKNITNTKKSYIQPQGQSLSNLIVQVCQGSANDQINLIYWTAKKNMINQRFQQAKKSENSIFIRPRNDFPNRKMSKSQKNYFKHYRSSLGDVAKQHNQVKPLESSLCVNNYIYSQISVSGLASRKFNSVKSKRRVENIRTESTDFKDYPLSPHLTSVLNEIQFKKNQKRMKIKTLNSEFNPEIDEYQETFLKNDFLSTDQYLKNFVTLKAKKASVYKTKYQDLQKINKLAQNDGFENLDFYQTLIQNMNKSKKKREQKKRKGFQKRIITEDEPELNRRVPQGSVLFRQSIQNKDSDSQYQ